MRSSRVAPFSLLAMLGAAIIALGTVDGHCGVAVDQNSADALAVQAPDQIDSAPSLETPLSGQTDPAPLSGTELPEEANQFDACAEDYCSYDHASQEESEEKDAEYVDDTDESYYDDEEYAYDDQYDYDGYTRDENADLEDAAEEEESWAADDDYAYDEEDYWHDGDDDTYDDQGDDDEYSYEYGSWDSEYGYDSEDEDEYSDEAFDYGMEDLAEEKSDDSEENDFSYEYEDYDSEYGYEYEDEDEDESTEEESVSVDNTASDVPEVEETESAHDDGQWDDPYAYDSGEFEEPYAYTSEHDEDGEDGEDGDEDVDEDEGDDDFTYEEYGAWESEYDESDPCELDAAQSECVDEVEDASTDESIEQAPADESIEQAPADIHGYSDAYPEEEFAYPEEADGEMAEVDQWRDTTEEDATSDDYWAEYDYEYSYPETKYGSPDAMDEEIDENGSSLDDPIESVPLDEGEPGEAVEKAEEEVGLIGVDEIDLSSRNNPVVGAVVSMAVQSYGSVTSAIRIVSTQLVQIDTVNRLRGFGQTCVAAYAASSVSQYQ